MVIISDSLSSYLKDHLNFFPQWSNNVNAGDDATKILAMSNIEKPELAQQYFQPFLGKVATITDGLKTLYNQKLKRFEAACCYNDFASPVMTDSEFYAKPMVLLLGQYSAGKTTFITHILGRDYPGAVIGQEPTTHGFTVVMDGPHDRHVVGNQNVVRPDLPFHWLKMFGDAFASDFGCASMPHPLLEHMTFIDTPGFASRESEQTDRGYDFCEVVRRLAHKCDMVLLFFDALNVGGCIESNNVMASLAGCGTKLHIVLNKADRVEVAQLRRFFHMMKPLDKVLDTTYLHIGSFNDVQIGEELTSCMDKNFLQKGREGLYAVLMNVPDWACNVRVNEFIERAQAAKIHACIISALEKKMCPSMMCFCMCGYRLKNLQDVFAQVQNELHRPASDFPDVAHFRQVLGVFDWNKLEKLNPGMISSIDNMIQQDIPNLLRVAENVRVAY